MRTLLRNKQKMYYALFKGEQPEYVLDENGNKILEYIGDDGVFYYRETGRTLPAYYEPTPFFGSISLSSGEVSLQEYGLDVSGYDAIVIVNKNDTLIDETSLIWFESEPKFKDADKTIVDGNTADYRVLAVKPSLNQLKLVLGRNIK